MKTLAVALLVIWIVPSVAIQAPDNTVSGTVIVEGTSAPLAGADVNLAMRTSQRTTTDTQGRFSFGNVPPGRYNLHVRRDGYFAPQSANAKFPDTLSGVDAVELIVSVQLTVTAGQPVKPLVMKLVPGGIISGRVRTATMSPLPNIKVVAVQPVYIDGTLTTRYKKEVSTNDRGEYRLLDLAPSEYFIEVQSSPRVYFPNAFTLGTAAGVIATSGIERAGTDITVTSLSGYSVSGTVARNLALTSSPLFYLIPTDVATASHVGLVDYSNVSFDMATGQFEVRNVYPGTYDVFGKVLGSVPGQNVQQPLGYFRGTAPVRVRDENVSKLLLDFHPNATIAGRLASPSSTSVAIVLTAKDSFLSRLSDTGTLVVPVDRAGNFTLKNVLQGQYRVQLVGLPQNSYLADIRTAGRSILNANILTIEDRQSDFEVTTNANGGTITGSVQSASGQQAPAAWVLLLSPQQSGVPLAIYQTGTSDAQGQFTFSGIAPGAYRLIALNGSPQGAELSPAFLSEHANASQPVVVQSNGRTGVTLRLLSK